jgi:hypothetical protein
LFTNVLTGLTVISSAVNQLRALRHSPCRLIQRSLRNPPSSQYSHCCSVISTRIPGEAPMKIDVQHLEEPKLQFGQYFEHEDTKTGLAEFGPFGKNIEGLHPAPIRLGFIGTRETIEDAQEWVAECKDFNRIQPIACRRRIRSTSRASCTHEPFPLVPRRSSLGSRIEPRAPTKGKR